MSEPENPAPGRPFSFLKLVGRLIIGFVLLLFVFFFLLPLIGYSAPFDLIITLAFGWVEFLIRTLPRISWNFDIIGLGVVCIALILFLANRFLAWITTSIASERKVAWRWPWKWTWCGLCATMLLFLVGMAMGGIVHQIGWIASSPEPWFEARGKGGLLRERFAMKNLELAFQIAMQDSDGDFEAIRHNIWKDEYGMKPFQEFHFLLIMEETNKVAGYITFPRNPQQCSRIGGIYSFGTNLEYITSDKLPDILHRHQGDLSAL